MSFFKKIIPFLKKRYAPRGARISFSASGEDIILSDLLKKIGVKKPFYIDIGAHDPIFGNNTYLLYRNRGQGIVVEPNEKLLYIIKQKRPRDITLLAGAAGKDGEAEYYSFTRSTRNTFSKDQANSWEKESGDKAEVKNLPLVSLDSLIMMHAEGKVPDVVSIDAEGLDMEILKGFSWTVRPKIFCIENEGEVIRPLMESKGYKLIAQVFQNSIFVDSNI